MWACVRHRRRRCRQPPPDAHRPHAGCAPPTLPPATPPVDCGLQYVDALRLGDVAAFRRIEAACEGWYSVGLDRGAGAALHFAVDHGRLEAVRFLVSARHAASWGWRGRQRARERVRARAPQGPSPRGGALRGLQHCWHAAKLVASAPNRWSSAARR